jgi:putative transcriptional regulator
LNYDRTVRQIPEGRPIDALLADYAARTLAPAQAALVAAHLELKPENRAYVAALEAVHGVFLEELKPVPLPGRDRRLVNIFASTSPEVAAVAPVQPAGEDAGVLPRALRRLAGCDLADLSWRKAGVGIRQVRLPDAGCGAARFISVAPGVRLPIAGEGGEAAVALVLAGAASGPAEYYERGDIVFSGTGSDGAPTAEREIDCVCFMVTEAPAKSAPGRLSRVLQMVMGG